MAKTTMESAGGLGSSAGASGFNTLARYLFGGNEASEAMAMTMPVEVTPPSTDGNGGSMAFVLPKRYAQAPPRPLDPSAVSFEMVPRRLVACKPFAGLVTDEEVSRQKSALLEAIAADGGLIAVGGDGEMAASACVSVLQYNSPLTIPWRRRNEVAIVVTRRGDADAVEGSVADPSLGQGAKAATAGFAALAEEDTAEEEEAEEVAT